jgi:hypothetical protein
MRFILIFLAALFTGSCVKQQTKDPVPHVEFVDFANAGKSTFTNGDTATIILSYEDGDGDLFVENFSDGANLQITSYYFDELSGTFRAFYDLSIQDTVRYSNTIKQPDSYYRNKYISGEIFIPMEQFRENDDIKVIRFTGFMIDRKKNKSNVFSSPVYTLNF